MLGISVEVVAVADAFENSAKGVANRYQVHHSRAHHGFSAYKEVANSDAEVVLMATPPSFRPLHFEACVQAGKHCFIEKPVAVDPVGARQVIATGELARQKGLTVVAGTQRRHTKGYLEMIAKLQSGATPRQEAPHLVCPDHHP